MSEFYGEIDEAESMATIGRALDLGATFIDTTDTYGRGHNEELVGRAIAGRRGKVQHSPVAFKSSMAEAGALWYSAAD